MNSRVSFFPGPLYLSIQRNRTFFRLCSIPNNLVIRGNEWDLRFVVAVAAATATSAATLYTCAVGELLRLGVIHGGDHITNEEKHHGKPTKIIVAW